MRRVGTGSCSGEPGAWSLGGSPRVGEAEGDTWPVGDCGFVGEPGAMGEPGAAPLYEAAHKFKSGHGWPAFFDTSK